MDPVKHSTAAQRATRLPGDAQPARPFLKWAGGKTQLLDQLRPLLPARHGTYFEPCLGGAALFFALGAMGLGRAVLTDVNEELIGCYCAVRDHVDLVIDALGRHEYTPDHYYRVRDLRPAALSPHERAARTIYLNKTGYNGLYRVNRSGGFNVPIGRYRNPLFCDPPNLRACSNALQGVDLRVRPFEAVLEDAKARDFVYFDPPYVPVSATSDFTSYVPGGFGMDHQRRLADVFSRLAAQGVHVMLSNSDTPEVRALYDGFRFDVVLASRHINSNAGRRGKVGEVVVRNFDRPTDPPRACSKADRVGPLPDAAPAAGA
jgi:DNA adenine methylase